MREDDSLAGVVAGCQRGEGAAQRQLFDRCHRNVYRLAVRMVGENDAEDLTQQVFLRVFTSIGQFSGRSRFATWLYRVTVNECLQHLRRRPRMEHQVLACDPADRATPYERRAEQRDLLENALRRLEPELRSIFLLREIEGLSYEEIAQSVDIPSGTVGSRLNRARRQLKAQLIQLGWEP